MRHASGRSASARRARGLQGVPALRKKLRRIDPAISGELKKVVKEGAEAIMFDAVSGAPRQFGDLQYSIDYKISSDGFTAVIGPGVKAAEIVRRKTGSAFGHTSKKVNLNASNKHDLYQYFKGYWIEFGTKGGNGVAALQANPFMQPAYKTNERWIVDNTRNAINSILDRVAKS
jgi:hypothetical protein